MIRNVTLLLPSAVSTAWFCLAGASAGATPHCAPRSELVEVLTSHHSKSRKSHGLAVNGSVIETFAAEDGTWTILVTRPDGISCMLADGQAFASEGSDAAPA